MNLLTLLQQDVINLTETFAYFMQEKPFTIFSIIVINLFVVVLAHVIKKKQTDPNYITQKICMSMDYTYQNKRYSALYINERFDGKIDITNENNQVMFREVEDALSVSKIIMHLKKGKYRKQR